MTNINYELLRIRCSGTWGPGDDFDISLVRMNDVFILKGKRYRQSESGGAKRSKQKKFKVDKAWVETLLDTLRKATIPLYPPEVFGCDGEFFSLKLGTPYGGATYQWWSAPPKGWNVLSKVTGRIINKFTVKLKDD